MEIDEILEDNNSYNFTIGEYEVGSIGGNDYCIEDTLTGTFEILRDTDEVEIKKYLMSNFI